MKSIPQNIPVDEFTSPDLKSVTGDTSLNDVICMMDEMEIRHLPVVEDKKLVGIISDRDIMLGLHKSKLSELSAKDVMTEAPYCVSPNTPMSEVALYLSSNKIGSAVVVNENDDYMGIFTSTDALNALVEVLRGDV